MFRIPHHGAALTATPFGVRKIIDHPEAKVGKAAIEVLATYERLVVGDDLA